MEFIQRKNKIIQEAVEFLQHHFDTHYDHKARAWENTRMAYAALGKDDLEFIQGELKKLRDPITGMRYYLQNYHVIKTEDGRLTTLHTFWEAQEIFFEAVIEIKVAGLPVKVIVLKARQLGLCLDPKTKVLTADLRWVEIQDVQPGDKIVAVDEGQTPEEWRARIAEYQRNWKKGVKPPFQKQKRKARKLRTAEVIAKREVVEPGLRITLDDGRVLTSTPQHRFLCKQRGGPQPIWMPVEDMRIGDEIRWITKPWDEPNGDDRWFGGLMDGEGCLRQKKGGVEASVSQVLNNVYRNANNYLLDRGYTFREDTDDRQGGESSKLGNQPVGKLVLSRIDEIFRLIGQTRPVRFLEEEWWSGKELPGKGSGIGYAKIVAIESVPAQRFIDLQTSAKTFIAEGFVSHNSTISEGIIFYVTAFTPLCNTLVVAQDIYQSDYLFTMCRTAYDFLPWWLQPEKQYEAKGKYMQFDREDDYERQRNPGLKSNIFVEAANKMTGVAVGKTFRAAHLSEISRWPNGKVLSEQILPSLNAPDTIVVAESTAQGKDNFFYKLWKDVWEGNLPQWRPVFIEFFRVKKYSLPLPKDKPFLLTTEEEAIRARVYKEKGIIIRPDQFNWRRAKMQEFLAIDGTEDRFYQEYPASTWIEAFTGSGLGAFNHKKLQIMLETTCRLPGWFGEIEMKVDKDGNKRPELKRHRNFSEDAIAAHGNKILVPPAKIEGARLRIWEMPTAQDAYYIGADAAKGVEGGDFSCAQVVRIGRGNEPDTQVAEWHGWIDATPYAKVLWALGVIYNMAEIAVEINEGYGLTTNNYLMLNLEYEKIYRWKRLDRISNQVTNYTGWTTNSKTRPQIINKGREGVNDGTVVLRSDDLIDEMMDFAQLSENSRIEGQSLNDDRVMAILIALWCAHDSDWGQQVAATPIDEHEKEKDFQNTPWSPLYDKEGLHRKAFEEMNVPAAFVHELALYQGSQYSDDDDWRNM